MKILYANAMYIIIKFQEKRGGKCATKIQWRKIL